MNLDDWLKKNPDKAKGFHERIGVTTMSLWRYLNRRHKPRDDVMGMIVRATAGAVTANDFYNIAQRDAREGSPPSGGSKNSRKSKRHPLIGWMKGTFTIAPGVDLTQPAMPEWGEVAYGDKTWDDFK
jgi:hypothetical protein